MNQGAGRGTNGTRRLATLDPLGGPLPQAHRAAPFYGHSTKGNLYTYVQGLAATTWVCVRL